MTNERENNPDSADPDPATGDNLERLLGAIDSPPEIPSGQTIEEGGAVVPRKPDGEYRPGKRWEVPYKHLAVVVLSNVLQEEGIIPVDVLKLRLAGEGVTQDRSDAYLSRLGSFGLVEVEESTVMVSRRGMGYMAKHGSRIGEAHEAVRERSQFPADSYQILALLEADAKARINPEEDTSIINDKDPRPLADLVAEKVGLDVDDATKIMAVLQANGLVRDERGISRLTQAGSAELFLLRDMFPEEAVEEDRLYKLRDTIVKMGAEIRLMRTILGYDELDDELEEDPLSGELPPEALSDPQTLHKDEMSGVIAQLEANMIKLEGLIDRGNPRLRTYHGLSSRQYRYERKQDPLPETHPDSYYRLPPA